MSTQAQVVANQANAQRSTGPTTAEGKQRASKNALRHGLTSREVVIPSGQEAEFAQFQQALQVEIRPEGMLEQVLFRQLVHAAWNLERIRQLQAATGFADPQFALLLRYEAHTERSFHRMLKQLREIQTLRHEHDHHEANIEPLVAAELPPLADPRLDRHRHIEELAIRMAEKWTAQDATRDTMPAWIGGKH